MNGWDAARMLAEITGEHGAVCAWSGVALVACVLRALGVITWR